MHGFCFSSDDARQQHGVGFIGNKTRIKSVHQLHASIQQNCYIWISAKPKNMIMQIYALTSTFGDLVEEFYEELESTIKEIP